MWVCCIYARSPKSGLATIPLTSWVKVWARKKVKRFRLSATFWRLFGLGRVRLIWQLYLQCRGCNQGTEWGEKKSYYCLKKSFIAPNKSCNWKSGRGQKEILLGRRAGTTAQSCSMSRVQGSWWGRQDVWSHPGVIAKLPPLKKNRKERKKENHEVTRHHWERPWGQNHSSLPSITLTPSTIVRQRGGEGEWLQAGIAASITRLYLDRAVRATGRRPASLPVPWRPQAVSQGKASLALDIMSINVAKRRTMSVCVRKHSLFLFFFVCGKKSNW